MAYIAFLDETWVRNELDAVNCQLLLTSWKVQNSKMCYENVNTYYFSEIESGFALFQKGYIKYYEHMCNAMSLHIV